MARSDRSESWDRSVRERFATELTASLRRRTPSEGKVGGALRELAPHSASTRQALAEAADVLVRRGSFDRELYSASIRCLAELGDKRVVPLLKTALASEEAGGLATLTAACFVKDASLAPLLGKVAAGRHAHLAFAAEVARVARGESNGAYLGSLAPKIKESHRIELCSQLLLPLIRGPVLTATVGPSLAVLRDTERHLGRWLVLAEVAARAGDPEPLTQARQRAATGAMSARAAWSLVSWALAADPQPPATRPTVELVSRLSDRPSAERDTTFLFRLAAAGSVAARPMLEALARAVPLPDEVAVRAASYLARDHHRDDMRAALRETASTPRHEELRGVACAALWDGGDHEVAAELAQAVVASKHLASAAWAALVLAARERGAASKVLHEHTFRRVQWGWVE